MEIQRDIPKQLKEVESQGKVEIAFYGHTHAGLNLEGIESISSTLREVFARTQGKRVLYLEYPEGASDFVKRGIRQFGLFRAEVMGMMIERSGTVPAASQIDRKIAQISSSSLEEIIAQRLIPTDDLHNYFLWQELDRIGGEFDFEVHPESHSEKVSKQVKELYHIADDRVHRAADYWHEGNFDMAKSLYYSYEQASVTASLLREREIIKELKDLIKNLLKGKNGGYLFIPFGYMHAPMMNALQRSFQKETAIVWSKNVQPSTPIGQLDILIRGKNHPSDELLARGMLVNVISAEVKAAFSKEPRLLTFLAGNFEAISQRVVELANNFSLEQIRKVCEEKQDISSELIASIHSTWHTIHTIV